MALTKVDPSVVNDQVIGRRNMVYNGKMQVSQRNGTGNTAVGWSNADHFPADRWQLLGSSLGNWAFTIGNRPDLTLPDGFGNAVLFECTTADTSITQGEYIIFRQKFEGSDLQHLCYGTSSAKEITLSFYINSTSTGTYLAELETGSYINGIKFTIDQANTWERKTITFTGNTAASIANTNSAGLSVAFWFAAGSTYQGGTFVSNTWRNSYAANTRAAGISNLASSTSNNLYITGIQLEVGDTATPFEHRSIAEETNLCERYFQIHGGPTGTHIWTGDITSGYYYYNMIDMRCQMSRTPTITKVGETLSGFNSISIASDSIYGIRAYTLSNTTQARGYYQARYKLDAEL